MQVGAGLCQSGQMPRVPRPQGAVEHWSQGHCPVQRAADQVCSDGDTVFFNGQEKHTFYDADDKVFLKGHEKQ